ncbi:MAG: thiamine phosphate synthase [Acidobacteria bacterium]|nr:thiamine phosphate synthase [Acidobacteriota bacterium]
MESAHTWQFMGSRIPHLYAIIDAAQMGAKSPLLVAETLLLAGVRLIQYRDKTGTSRRLYDVSQEIAGQARRWNALFIVNDRADIARSSGAHGVHLGQEDLPVEMARRVLRDGQQIGISTHTLAQVSQAESSSADYVAFGPIFATRSKDRPDPVVGLDGLRQARALTRKPLVAIGGITLTNAPAVIEAGADSVAVIHDLLAAEDIGARAREFLRLLGE